MPILTPQQFGILAQYIFDVVEKYPDLKDDGESGYEDTPAKPVDAVLPESWEQDLMNLVNGNPELPDYDDLHEEVDWLLDYYTRDRGLDVEFPPPPLDNFGTLAESMHTKGLMQPVLVVEAETPGQYYLVTGYRRVRVATHLGWATIQAVLHSVVDGGLGPAIKTIRIAPSSIRDLVDQPLLGGNLRYKQQSCQAPRHIDELPQEIEGMNVKVTFLHSPEVVGEFHRVDDETFTVGDVGVDYFNIKDVLIIERA